jgi:hypothetical protein
VQAKPLLPGIHTPSLYFSGPAPGEPFEMHCEDHWLYSLNYLHRGAPKYWVIVAPHERKHLEKCLWGYMSNRWGLGWERPRCSQFVRHLSVWVSLGALKSWDIDYELVKQQPGELMVTAPEAYHQGWSGGANVAEAINFGDGASPQRSTAYKKCSVSCSPETKKRKPVRLWWSSDDLEVTNGSGAAASQNRDADLVNGVLPDPKVPPWCLNDIPRNLLGAARCVVGRGKLDARQVRLHPKEVAV